MSHRLSVVLYLLLNWQVITLAPYPTKTFSPNPSFGSTSEILPAPSTDFYQPLCHGMPARRQEGGTR